MSKNIAFVVSSHIKSYKTTIKGLIDDFNINNIKLEDVLFYVGGFDNESIEEIDGLLIRKVKHNSMDFTGIISLLEDEYFNYTYDYTHYFFIHDTVKLGDRFYDNVINANLDNARLTSDFLGMNMGMLTRDYIISKKDEILMFKNTDYNIDSIKKFKSFIISKEDIIFIKLKDSFNKTKRIITGPVDYYGNGTLRIIEYYKDLDLYKIKANWFYKDNYKEYELKL